MAEKVGELYVDIEGRIHKLDAALNKAEKRTQVAQGKITKYMKQIGTAAAGMFGGYAVISGLKKGFDAFVQLDKGMRNVNSIAGLTQKQLDGLTKGVVTLSDKIGTPTSDLTGALYQTVSAGIDAGDSLKFLEVASKTATAGLTSTESAVDALTTVINAFGLSADDAESVADDMFTTIRLGKTTAEELAASYNIVAKIASTAGVSFKDISAAVATLTKQGVPTSIAMTQIRAALIAMNKELGDGWTNTWTLNEGMQEMVSRANGSQNALKDMVGRIEGVNAILGLTGESLSMANSDIEEFTNNAGELGKAFEENTKSISYQLQLMQTRIENVLIQVVESLLPAFQSWLDIYSELGKDQLNMSGDRKEIEDTKSSIEELGEVLLWWTDNVATFAPRMALKAIKAIVEIASESWRAVKEFYGNLFGLIDETPEVNEGDFKKAKQLMDLPFSQKRQDPFNWDNIIKGLDKVKEKSTETTKEVEDLFGSFDVTTASIKDTEAEIERLGEKLKEYNQGSREAKEIYAKIQELSAAIDLEQIFGDSTEKLKEQKQFIEDIISADEKVLERITWIDNKLKDQALSLNDINILEKERAELVAAQVRSSEAYLSSVNKLKEIRDKERREGIETDKFGQERIEIERIGITPQSLDEEVEQKIKRGELTPSGEVDIDKIKKHYQEINEANKEADRMRYEYAKKIEYSVNSVLSLAHQIQYTFGIAGHTFVGYLTQAIDKAQSIANIILQVIGIIQGFQNFFGIGGLAAKAAGGLYGGTFQKGKKIQGFQRGGDFIVPPYHTQDTYPLLVSSNERVRVTPSGKVSDEIKAMESISKSVEGLNENILGLMGGSQDITIPIKIDGKELTVVTHRKRNSMEKRGYKFNQI